MRRRVWGSLSESYRRRLEKGGITREAYEGGASLKSARGHSTTPESIKEYQRAAKTNPNRFKEYRERRKEIVERVIEKKKQAFQHTVRWNEEHSEGFVRYGYNPQKPPKKLVKRSERDFIKPPTLKQLQFIDSLTVDQLVDYQYEVKADDDWRWLWYH